MSLHEKQLSMLKLIRKAIDIDPGNAAILDSLAGALLDGSMRMLMNMHHLHTPKIRILRLCPITIRFFLKNGYKQKAKILEQSLMNNPENDELLQLLMKMAMKQLSCKSFAKLNLCLHVINRRDDGYHDIQTFSML